MATWCVIAGAGRALGLAWRDGAVRSRQQSGTARTCALDAEGEGRGSRNSGVRDTTRFGVLSLLGGLVTGSVITIAFQYTRNRAGPGASVVDQSRSSVGGDIVGGDKTSCGLQTCSHGTRHYVHLRPNGWIGPITPSMRRSGIHCGTTFDAKMRSRIRSESSMTSQQIGSTSMGRAIFPQAHGLFSGPASPSGC
jgi:hypothetical protein